MFVKDRERIRKGIEKDTPSASASFVQPGRLGNETYLRHG
jgi:hypothetical protein